MNVTEKGQDIRTMVTKLSDENKKYVIAVAQALLFTQIGTEEKQEKREEGKCQKMKW